MGLMRAPDRAAFAPSPGRNGCHAQCSACSSQRAEQQVLLVVSKIIGLSAARVFLSTTIAPDTTRFVGSEQSVALHNRRAGGARAQNRRRHSMFNAVDRSRMNRFEA